MKVECFDFSGGCPLDLIILFKDTALLMCHSIILVIILVCEAGIMIVSDQKLSPPAILMIFCGQLTTASFNCFFEHVQ